MKPYDMYKGGSICKKMIKELYKVPFSGNSNFSPLDSSI